MVQCMNRFGIYFLISFVLVSSFQCARRSLPTGGFKDTLPPNIVNTSPKMNTVFFDKEKITITFDEYIKLVDLNKQLIISPPLEPNKYKVKPQGTVSKKIQIELLDSLLENTTYTFNFGESIIDNNEGNLLPFFNYAISTGAIIDSLEIKGKIIDSYERITDSYTSVYLYPIDSTYTDSTIFLKKPFYATSTLDSTAYNFRNLRPDKYQIVAIKDISGNYIFDQSVDKIGFIEEPITLPGDSVINFRIFKEVPNLYWSRPFFINKNKIGFGYFGKPEPSAIKVQSKVPRNFRYIINKDRKTDTLNFWFRGSMIDSIKFGIEEKDTTKTYTIQIKDIKPDSLVISSITKNSIELIDSFKIKSSLPIVKVNMDLINIVGLDSLEVQFEAFLDKNYDELAVTFDALPNDNYKIEFLPDAMVDFWGQTHDTLRYSVKTRPISDYGNLYLQILREDKSPFILELVDLKGKVLRRYDKINDSDYYEFKYLLPGKYLFRYIRDKNGNKKWDTGNYLKKIQPEIVYYSTDTIDLRANWDINQQLRIPSEIIPISIGNINK